MAWYDIHSHYRTAPHFSVAIQVVLLLLLLLIPGPVSFHFIITPLQGRGPMDTAVSAPPKTHPIDLDLGECAM